MFQIYLVSAITLFALPNISVHFAGFFRHLTMPFMLPVAHIGMVNITSDRAELNNLQDINVFSSGPSIQLWPSQWNAILLSSIPSLS